MTPSGHERLREIRTFAQLVKYLRDDLGWPVESDNFEDLTFEYEPEELGLDARTAVKVRKIHQLRPLTSSQPWGIFFLDFEPKRLPVVVLRKILSALVIRKRQSPARAQRASWRLHDLLFISSYGEQEHRDLTFAHFSEDPDSGDLPALRVLGWDDEDTVRHLEHADHVLTEKLHWPSDEADTAAWRQAWSEAFTLKHRETITTSKALAKRLAELAKAIRKRVNAVLAVESERGTLRKLMSSFKEALIHDLTTDDFADAYAQTITYGLLAARVSRPAGLVAENITDMVPATNPFLRDLLATFLKAGGRRGKLDFDELGVNDVVELLRAKETDMEAVMRDFDDRNPQDDPVIHFYELFLKEYDPNKRIKRGVFFTPRPVVSFIVRSVDEVLRTEFGLKDGLADTTTWGEMIRRHPDLQLPDGAKAEDPFVQVLDPACGTGTFLVEVIDVIHRTLVTRWKLEGASERAVERKWNEYVPDHLLPRLYGFELMMAPYAIAHMKIGLKLADTRYRFGSAERARVYLTNTLEPPQDFTQRVLLDAPALAHEAQAVNTVKRTVPFTVVMGNPPYSHMSANLTAELRRIVDIYRRVDGEVIRERGAIMFERTLQDDYVKFHAFADRLTEGIPAIRAYITNSAYLDSPSLRGMRCYIADQWPSVWLLDLCGDVKRASGGDENVFDIRTGVAVAVLLRPAQARSVRRAAFCELSGPRATKYSLLNSQSVLTIDWSTFQPRTPYYLFRPQTSTGWDELDRAPSIHDVFVLKSEAIKTNRDHLVIGETDKEILQRIRAFTDPTLSTAEVKEALGIRDNTQWDVDSARIECRRSFSRSHVTDVAYRPFDDRRIYYHPSVVFNPRPVLANNVLGRDNRVLLTSRRIRSGSHAHFFISDKIAVKEMLSSSDNCNGYPLYRFERHFSEEERSPNLAPEFLRALAATLGLRPSGQHGLPQGVSPEEILHYAYAVFHSPVYRSRYAELLKIDFARLPLTGSLVLFRSLARLGHGLTALHLLDSATLDGSSDHYIGRTSPEVEAVSYSEASVWLDRGRTSGFRDVSPATWQFRIGGYQVCEKWLKDRRGRVLTDEDIAHYQKIIIAISETIRIMSEIDKVIEEHGGWPDAFLTKSEQ